ncbi:hypothetical protein AOQ84DRAFT_324797 [Glonium stellatum]|uniref:Protein kinase domain-containing protein n=1 Tax=Glonium stellatum TaxID=574774 RepID=A0A8E2ETP7_9PEZI|nr:hypothetical protein AOQ84DRAFT_324797 [Glonium stellatum]
MRIIPDLVSSYDFANSPTAPLPIDEHLRTDQIDHPHEHAEQPTAEEQPPEIDILEELMRNTNLELAGVDSSEALTTLPRVDFSSDTTSIPGMFFHDIPWNPLGSSTYTHPDALSKLQEAIELTAADHDPEISGQRSKRQGIHIRSETESTGSYVTAKTSSTATYFTASSKLGDHNPPALSSIRGFIPRSSWYSHLESRGMIPDAFFEKDWSGRGQHAEFEPDEADLIPLRVEKVIGYSATALVESVMCRRIRLARKTIMCGRRIKREDAVTEVEHLQRLSHFHLIQVIGTCIMGKHLSILLYPVAQYNLETFMDSITERTIVQGRKGKSSDEISAFKTLYLYDFVGCLSNGLHYIHASGTKHMDIKPKNLLPAPIDL